jgi:DNA-binding protein HU-beta
MNKFELSQAIALGADIPIAKGEEVLYTIMRIIEDQVSSHNTVQLSGFGTFAIKSRNARVGRNPKTGELIQIQSSLTIRFIAGKSFKDQVNQAID